MAHILHYRQCQQWDYSHSLSSSPLHSIRPQISHSIRPQPSHSVRPPPSHSIRPQSSHSTSRRPQPKRRKSKKKPLRKMKIKIFLPNDEYISVRMVSTALIQDIKHKIENKIGVSSSRQQLFFQGEALNDDWTLKQSNFPTAIFLSIPTPQIQIWVKTLSGKTMKMNAAEMDTIKIVKERIEKEEGIAANHQRLIFDGKELDDHHDLTYYQITSGSILYSTLRFRTCGIETSNIRIDIRTTADHKIAALFTHRSTSIQDIKAMIEHKTNVLLQLEDDLIFAGQILENTLCLSDYHIYNNSTLYLRCADDHEHDALSSPSFTSSSGPMLGQIPEMEETFEIYIEIPEMYHRVIQLEVEANETIESIKGRIEAKEVISVEDQMLTHLQKVLDDDHTLCHYNIDCESVLQLKLRGFSKFLVDKLE